MSDLLSTYIKHMEKLRQDAGRNKYPAQSLHKAPHKPLLILALLDRIDRGEVTTNLFPLDGDLAELFDSYWKIIMPLDRIGRLYMPFFHMKSDGFWHLVPHPGQEAALKAIRQIGGHKQLRETVFGGRFDPDLFELLMDVNVRHKVRTTIIEKYFDPQIRQPLFDQAYTNQHVHDYSLQLLATARRRESSMAHDSNDDQRPIRDQGFRRAIVKVYDHRCVLCGIRLVTDDGRTAANAAHIIPWSLSHNDNPTNGLCLCPLCHWTFDVGLAAINTNYRIRLSSQLTIQDNMPGHLSTLHDRPIFEPTESVFNPNEQSLQWHMSKVFLR